MTKFQIIDNSGGLKAQLIKVLKKKKGNIGDLLVVSIIKALPNKKVKKGEVHKALLIRTKQGLIRGDGTHLKFNENGIILLTSDFSPIGTRVLGPVPLEIHSMKKIAAISSHFI